MELTKGLFVRIIKTGPSRRLGLLLRALAYLSGRDAVILISSISFTFLVSVFPFIALLLTLSHYFHSNELREAIFDSFHRFFPISQDFIIRNLRVYTRELGSIQLVSFLLLIWGVSAFFFSVEAGLDSAYRVSRYRRFSRSQILSNLMVILIGGVALVFITFFGEGPVLGQKLSKLLGESGASFLGSIFSGLINLSVTLAFFLPLYVYLPNRFRGIWRVAPEALFSALLWTGINFVFRSWAPYWDLKNIYGPFYVSVTLLLWAYTFGCTLLLGARLSRNGFFSRSVKNSRPLVNHPEESLGRRHLHI